MSQQKLQNIFHPLLNFFGSGLLIIFSPGRFFRSFAFLKSSWQRTLGYALCYKYLATFVYVLAFQVFLAAPLMQAVKGALETVGPLPPNPLFTRALPGLFYLPTWVSLLLIPLTHVPHMLFWAGVMWAASQVSRSGFRFKELFSLLNAFPPYEFFGALIFGVAVLFSNSLSGWLIVGGMGFLLSIVLLFLVVRTFHVGAQAAIADTLVRDKKALSRFYLVSGVAFAMPVVIVVVAVYLWARLQLPL